MMASTPTVAARKWLRSTASVDIGTTAVAGLLMFPVSPRGCSGGFRHRKLRAGESSGMTQRPNDLLRRPQYRSLRDVPESAGRTALWLPWVVKSCLDFEPWSETVLGIDRRAYLGCH